MKKKVHLLPVALAFLIGLGTVGCGNRQKTAGTAPETVTSVTWLPASWPVTTSWAP